MIAIADIKEQYRICEQLVAIGVDENQIRFLNYWLLRGLQDFTDVG